MKRDLFFIAAFCGLSTLLGAPRAFAQENRMPPGHPAVNESGDDGAGPGDPSQGGDAEPHAASANPMDAIPQDGALEDPSIAKGTVEVHVMDADGKPMPRTEVTLGIVYNSIAKGESRKHATSLSDDAGLARFKDLDTGSGVSYRPMVMRDGATFSVSPFQLGPKTGIRALLHVYPVTSDISQTRIVSQSMLYAEVKDDRVQLQEAFTIYNFGRNAWVPPSDFIVSLPDNYTAFATQQGMTDVGADPVPLKGVKIRGTFPPGQQVIEFRWQVPYAGEAEVKLDVGMPPRLAAARVIAPASKNMGLDVEGFEPAQVTVDGMGQRSLLTEKRLTPNNPLLKELRVTVKGLPTEGPGRVIASLLAFSALLMGVVLGSRKAPPRDTKREREQLLAALEALEHGHRDGSIGPKTYERGRRELIDDIARTFAAEPKPEKKSPRRRATA